MTSHTAGRPYGYVLRVLATTLGACAVLGSSCIIPDHGIVALVDCGAKWCATAEFAEAFDIQGKVVQVQETQPDGATGWVTECVCMTPADDAILLAGAPPMQYELLRTQIVDAARQACLDAAVANGLDLRFASSPTAPSGPPIGLELEGVAPDSLAGHLGLRDGDIVLRVADLPLTTEAELLHAATVAQSAESLAVLVLRDGAVHQRYFVRTG